MSDVRMIPVSDQQRDALEEMRKQLRLEARVVYADRLTALIAAYDDASPAEE